MFARLLVVIAVALAGLATGPQAFAAPGDVSDPNIVYVGRWTNTSTTAVPNWTGGYFSTRFTGTTVRVKARDAVIFAELAERTSNTVMSASTVVRTCSTPGCAAR